MTPATAPATRCCGHHDAFAILHDCHEHILERLARLEALAGELGGARAFEERHLAVLGDVLAFLDVAVPMHTEDEEYTLLPRLREAVGPALVHTPVHGLEREHAQHQALLAGLKRAVVQRDPVAAARAALAVVAEYRGHIRNEEEVIFPWARRLLADPAVLATMLQEMRRRRQMIGLSAC